MHKKLNDSSDKSLSESQMFGKQGEDNRQMDVRVQPYQDTAKNKLNQNSSKDSLVKSVVDTMMSFPSKFLGVDSKAKEDNRGEDL